MKVGWRWKWIGRTKKRADGPHQLKFTNRTRVLTARYGLQYPHRLDLIWKRSVYLWPADGIKNIRGLLLLCYVCKPEEKQAFARNFSLQSAATFSPLFALCNKHFVFFRFYLNYARNNSQFISWFSVTHALFPWHLKRPQTPSKDVLWKPHSARPKVAPVPLIKAALLFAEGYDRDSVDNRNLWVAVCWEFIALCFLGVYPFDPELGSKWNILALFPEYLNFFSKWFWLGLAVNYY